MHYLNKMSYEHVNVSLTSGQINKLQSKTSVIRGTQINLKHKQMIGGPNKLSLIKTQHSNFNKAISVAAVNNMIKSGGFFPLIIPALTALATGALSGFAG